MIPLAMAPAARTAGPYLVLISCACQVFHRVMEPMVHDALNLGTSGLVFAYGMTNAGKTHTVLGHEQDPGLLPRTLQLLFALSDKRLQEFRFTVSFLEVYNEGVYDLLAPQTPIGRDSDAAFAGTARFRSRALPLREGRDGR